ncbi:DUF982 domain-containing protein [Sinorhizobium fredii]|uniref:DUF982 domain-containing protein n=1 Tax=Rhizobium fredii TaxID=380 RepID=UPI001F0AD0C9|nr:DUF982 domain-containing protein [Sinorhizobium fredii]
MGSIWSVFATSGPKAREGPVAAYRACRDVLDGWRQPHEARRAFVKAARRAGLLEDIAWGSPAKQRKNEAGLPSRSASFSPTKGR